MVEIREERSADVAAVRVVEEAAFDRAGEADLVDRLRDAGKGRVSLVAIDAGRVVGHILFTPLTMSPSHPSFNGVGLAPLAVAPQYQRRGIGERLVREGLRACAEAGHEVVAVLGDPAYYRRFGFAAASQHGLRSEYDAGDTFMVMALRDGALDGLTGTLTYEPEFNEPAD